MENAYPVIECEAEVTQHGTLSVPRAVARSLVPGAKYTVRLVRGGIASALRSRGVTEDEVERIAERQYEPRDNVLRFLKTEGALAPGAGFGTRASAGKA